MGDRLRGGECKGNDTTEQIPLPSYPQALCGVYPDQRIVRHEVQSVRIAKRGIVFTRETAALDRGEPGRELAQSHAFVMARGTARIGDDDAAALRCQRHRSGSSAARKTAADMKVSANAYAISNRPAAPMPPPMHIVTTTYLTPRRLPSSNACPVSRVPDTP